MEKLSGRLLLLCIFLLISGCLLVCLGWIMKATYCLLRYNPELMLDVVNLNMPCFYFEITENHTHGCIWCGYSHLIRRLTDSSWSETSEDIFICFSFAFCFLDFFLAVAFICVWALFNEMAERKQTLVWPCTPTGTQYGENGPRLGDEVLLWGSREAQ